jgi:hypothetical protein
MTQHTDKVQKRKKELQEEKENSSISFIEIKFKDGSWSQRTVGYGDGKRVTEYSDKRKKDKIEWT